MGYLPALIIQMINPYYQTDLGVLYCGDCLEVMKELEDKNVDLVLTDPPYNRGYFSENLITFDFLNDCQKILKDNSTIYCFWSPKDIGNFDNEFKKRFNLLNIIICRFLNKTGFDSPYTWAKSYEPLFFGEKGKSKFKIIRQNTNDNNSFDVWNSVLPQTNFKGKSKSFHPTQKPIEVFTKCIIASSNEGDLILDPFLGSGTTAVAAEKLNRRWIGIEISEKYCEIAKKRIKEEADQGKLFR